MSIVAKIIKTILVLALVALTISFFKKNDLPWSAKILPELVQEPQQQATTAEPFTIEQDSYVAEVKPLYTYELYGLIVADYDSENWFDYFHKYDPFNTKDICVIWGDNLENSLYHKVKFKHGEFTCFYHTEDWETYQQFNHDQLSNNHLVPASQEIYQKIKTAQVSDQIFLKGYLTDNQIRGPDGLASRRSSSIIRTDQGNGACEVIYVTDFQVIKSGNPFYALAYKISLYTILVGLSLLAILFLVEVQIGWWRKPKDDT